MSEIATSDCNRWNGSNKIGFDNENGFRDSPLSVRP
jgi:hypothetical protein